MKPIARYHDWEQRLAKLIEKRQRRAFVWGKHDCCLFACDAVKAITGVDLARGFRGKYATKASAMKMIRAFTDSGTIEALAVKIAEQRGIKEVPTLCAQRGDVVVVGQPPAGSCQLPEGQKQTQRQALGIAGFNGDVLIAGPKGLASLPLGAALRAWRIGYHPSEQPRLAGDPGGDSCLQ